MYGCHGALEGDPQSLRGEPEAAKILKDISRDFKERLDG
jgi:hypothetical protein